MSVLSQLRRWWSERGSRPLRELLVVVEFDSEQLRVRVIERMDPQFNQTFRWGEITRVCFQDGGMYGSDVLYIELRNRDTPAIVFTETKGGSKFFDELCVRKLFPEEIWRRAIGETGGATHCWPPSPSANRDAHE